MPEGLAQSSPPAKGTTLRGEALSAMLPRSKCGQERQRSPRV
jgi:hypothetical protein